MKHALFLILKFLVLHFLLLLVVCVVYFLMLQSTQVVAGEPLVFLPFSAVFPALPFMLACVSLAAGFWVQCSCVRTGAKLIPQCATALTVLAAWLLVIPACAIFKAGAFPQEQAIPPQERISAGYFRRLEGGVLFATRGGKTADGVFLHTSGYEQPVLIYDIPADAMRAYPYSDSLVSTAIHTPLFLLLLAREAMFFAQIGRTSWSAGKTAWLCFASMCLPFAAISALTRSGTWKLKTITFMLFAFAAIVYANKLYYIYDVFETVSSRRDIPHAVFNALLAVIIALLGVLGTVVSARRTGADE